MNNVRNMTCSALMAALLVVCGWIAIPIPPVSFTLQTFGVLTALGVLGGKAGALSILLYLAMGAAGLPVFSGFQGGIGILAGVTGGYLWGFLAAGLTYWLLERFGKLPAMIAGQAVCYLCGSLWFLLYAGGGLWVILLRCVIPYLIPDGVKIALSYTLSRRLSRHIT